MPERPNCTLNGLVTVSPSFGLMMYTEALDGAAVCALAMPGMPINTAARKLRRSAEHGVMRHPLYISSYKMRMAKA